MPHKENIFDLDIVVGIIVIVLTVLVFSLYAILKPTKTPNPVFQAYPTFSPKQLPSTPIGNQSCFKQVVTCDPKNDDCSDSCGKGFTCEEIHEEDKISYPIGGPLLGKGNYCLPSRESSVPGIPLPIVNPNLGKWEWVDDLDYCSTVHSYGGNQCWKPRCFYPDLFGTAENGCNTFLGCNPVDGELNGAQGSLRFTEAGNKSYPKIKIGTIFDPISKVPPPGVDAATYSELIKAGPYQVDVHGEPFWACYCGNVDITNTEGNYPTVPPRGLCVGTFEASPQEQMTCLGQSDSNSCGNEQKCSWLDQPLFRPDEKSL